MEADSWSTNLHTGGSIAGRVGAASVEGRVRRDMKMKLKFANYMANTANGLLAAIFRKLTTEARPKIWVRQLREYLGELGLDFSDVGRQVWKSTHISMISNSVTHLRSYTNSAIAVNSAPTSPHRAPTSPHRATTSPHPAPILSHRITSARSPTSLPQMQMSPYRAPTSPHRAPIS